MLISLRREVWVHKTNSLTMTLFSEVPVPSQECERSCICVLGISIMPLSTIFLLDFGTVPTVLYFCFSFYRWGVNLLCYLPSSAVDRWSWTGQTKDYKLDICCFSGKHAALRRKNKDWLAWNQDNESEWGDMSIRALLFQWPSTIKIQLSVSV